MRLRNKTDLPLEQKSFPDHLEDLRGTLLKVLLVIVGATFLSFAFSARILHLLKFPLSHMLTKIGQANLEREMLRSLSPAGAFILSLKISFFSGLLLAFPFCSYFLSQFILPGLTSKEKKYLLPIFLWGNMLFILGVLLCYGVALPQSLHFFWKYHQMMGIIPSWTIENYISFSVFLMLSFGIAFELPLVILTLIKFDVLEVRLLREKRRHAIVIIVIVAAVLTPSTDAFSQILLALPMIILYEICIRLGGRIEKPKNEETV
ncbi:MAG: twin-arginine translocase subunit TatC [Chlamydiae bacterium]|nr:twin-arginine translocase subunit TatC [Chlamydiota bacterium]MBI3266024.1 twin-arginine translocase subunit TatC [Chlamydiota bacterium]